MDKLQLTSVDFDNFVNKLLDCTGLISLQQKFGPDYGSENCKI